MRNRNEEEKQDESLSEKELQEINGARTSLRLQATEDVRKKEKSPPPVVTDDDPFTLDDLLPGYLIRRFPFNMLAM